MEAVTHMFGADAYAARGDTSERRSVGSQIGTGAAAMGWLCLALLLVVLLRPAEALSLLLSL